MFINVAIDGPSGAGKSSVSKECAQKLQYIYIDTGALYRAIGIYVLEQGADTASEQQVAPLLKNMKIELKHIDGVQKVFLNDIDLTDEIRKPAAAMAASNVSAIGQVRDFLMETQQSIARTNNVIMDGRDIATIILPNAQVKIFLTTTPEERTRRRYLELKNKGSNVNYDELLNEMKTRDFNDSNRKIAPLKLASDAILIDNTGFEFEQSVEAVLGIIRSRLDVL